MRKLGLYNGLLLGLALSVGAWGPDAITLGRAHVALAYPGLALGALALLLAGGLAGWCAARWDRALLSGLIWILAAALMMLVIGHLPYEGRSLVIWLADPRFWGLAIYPFDAAAQARLLMAGFFVMLLLTLLGLLQPYRMEGVRSAVYSPRRLGGRAWFLLALPLPLVAGAGLIADDIVNSPLRTAPLVVDEAIRTGRTYTGDLFALSLERGVNYNAIAGVRDRLSANYQLQIAATDLEAATVYIVAHFDNGAWINCRVLAGQLSHCYDASPPYLQEFAEILERHRLYNCPGCRLRVGDEQRAWLQARDAHFHGGALVYRLAQWGSYVLLRAASPAGDYAIECLFRGVGPVRVTGCEEITIFSTGAGG